MLEKNVTICYRMFILYLIRGCSFCKKALKLAKEYKLNVSVHWVSQTEKDLYKEKHGMKTFPQIFHKYNDDITMIGGYSEFYGIVTSIKKLHSYKLTSKTIDRLWIELE